MSGAVLITQCLQHDFVGPLGHHEPPPSVLHVGHAEAERLLGRSPEVGALAQLMNWVRAQPVEALDVLHVRDFHDPGDPAQAAHLETFGPHCLVGSPGAQLVLDLDAGMRANESYVNARHLNDFVETDLEARLRALVDRHGPSLRVAVIGVWTDAKVSFVCYELATRLGLSHVATCSALTASRSREKHFGALDSLQRLLGVRITDSPGELANFLLPGVGFDGALGERTSAGPLRGPRVKLSSGSLDPADADAVAWLYRESAELTLHPLGGGFSGAAVYAVDSRDALGQSHAPTVLKVGPRALVAKERVAFERVESVLGNDVPRLLSTTEIGERGALKYAFATMGRGRVRTLKGLYEDGMSSERFASVMREVFDEVLGRFVEGATYESCPLVAHYGFSPRQAENVAEDVARLGLGDSPEGARLVDFYRQHVARLSDVREHHFVGYVHGDLNGANVLLDGRDNVWLIDFAHAARRHQIVDLVKMENDLLFLFQRLRDDRALAQAKRVVDVLLGVEDLAADLPELPDDVDDDEVRRAYACVRALRAHVPAFARTDRSPLQWSVAALRYAAHTLRFDEADDRQKRLAFHAAVGHVDQVLAGYARMSRLEIGWLPESTGDVGGRLGMTLCPGRRDRRREIERDLRTLVETGVGMLVCLLPTEELLWADVPDLPERARAHGLDFVHLPIRDQDVPAVADLDPVLARIEAGLGTAKVAVHCMGGLGRSGTVAACLLRRRGFSAEAAIAAVREARGPRCVENERQEAFVRAYPPPG